MTIDRRAQCNKHHRQEGQLFLIQAGSALDFPCWGTGTKLLTLDVASYDARLQAIEGNVAGVVAKVARCLERIAVHDEGDKISGGDQRQF